MPYPVSGGPWLEGHRRETGLRGRLVSHPVHWARETGKPIVRCVGYERRYRRQMSLTGNRPGPGRGQATALHVFLAFGAGDRRSARTAIPCIVVSGID